ncbi:MAG: TetR/AcrR family transcriptional regulator [Hyphomicrobiaceae bacterium]
MKRAEKKEHLISVAAEVFNRMGYHAAGVDRVIAEAGIAKTTLYRHFPSKEDLIVAVLDRIDEKFRDDMRRAVDARASEPREKLLATFDFLAEWFGDATFHGCPFVGAAGEYGERTSPVFLQAATHKRLVLAYFEELAHAAGFADPKRIAQEINLLHEGATAVAHMTGTARSAETAKATAARLINGA